MLLHVSDQTYLIVNWRHVVIMKDTKVANRESVWDVTNLLEKQDVFITIALLLKNNYGDERSPEKNLYTNVPENGKYPNISMGLGSFLLIDIWQSTCFRDTKYIKRVGYLMSKLINPTKNIEVTPSAQGELLNRVKIKILRICHWMFVYTYLRFKHIDDNIKLSIPCECYHRPTVITFFQSYFFMEHRLIEINVAIKSMECLC